METKLWMSEVKKCNTYYTMYHKRRLETTRNTLCGKIPGSELYNTPSFGQNTPCNEALASTERKKKLWRGEVEKSNKKMWYILHYVSQTSGENHPKCTLWQNPRGRALLHTLSWKKHNVPWIRDLLHGAINCSCNYSQIAATFECAITHRQSV